MFQSDATALRGENFCERRAMSFNILPVKYIESCHAMIDIENSMKRARGIR